jgi:hypothetical protein
MSAFDPFNPINLEIFKLLWRQLLKFFVSRPLMNLKVSVSISANFFRIFQFEAFIKAVLGSLELFLEGLLFFVSIFDS